MTASLLGTAGNVLVVIGVLVITLSVVGLLRMPSVYLQLHASGKAVVLGNAAIAAASVATAQPGTIARCLLIAAFLLVTTPIATHVIAQAAREAGEPLGGDSPVDESRP